MPSRPAGPRRADLTEREDVVAICGLEDLVGEGSCLFFFLSSSQIVDSIGAQLTGVTAVETPSQMPYVPDLAPPSAGLPVNQIYQIRASA